jgi:hypothetical protein
VDNTANFVSSNSAVPAVTASNTGTSGISQAVFATSTTGEALHGETSSPIFAAVTGLQLSTTGTGAGVYASSVGNGAAVFATSTLNEAVHAESHSATAAALTGLQLNTAGTGVGVYASSVGNGAAVLATSTLSEAVHAESNSPTAAALTGLQLNTASTGAGIYASSVGKGPAIWATAPQAEALHGETTSPIYAAVTGIQMNPQGTGAGVYGESRGKGPAGYFVGDVSVTGDVVLVGADCAEDFDLCANVQAPPGTVMVINEDGSLAPSCRAYDRRVAGVVSGAGRFRPGITLDRQSDASGPRCTIALVGKVTCFADASQNPISIGDLLTTSDLLGHAMRADSSGRAFGSIIGKALTPLASGQGLVAVLIAQG